MQRNSRSGKSGSFENSKFQAQRSRSQVKFSKESISGIENIRRSSSTSGKPLSRGSLLFQKNSGFGVNKTVKDLRPIQDKAYKEDIVSELFEFLKSRGYPYALKVQTLHMPSESEFRNIIEFLVSFLPIPSSFELNKKLDEFYPELMSCLGYPFPILKRHLHTIGAPHQWPHLLLSLQFLLHQSKLNEELIMMEEQNQSLQIHDFLDPNQLMKESLASKGYHDYIENGDNMEQVKEQLYINLTNDLLLTKYDDERMKNSKLMSTKNQLDLKSQQLKERIKSEELMKEQCLENQGKLQMILKEEEVNRENAKVSHLQGLENLRSKKLDLEEILKRKRELEERLQTQEALPFDVKKMMIQNKKMQDQVKLYEVHIQEKFKELEGLSGLYDAEMSKRCEEINVAKLKCSEFPVSNEERLVLSSVNANFDNVQYFIQHLFSIQEIINNIKVTIDANKENSERIKNKLKEENKQLEQAIDGKDDQLLELEKQINLTKMNLEALHKEWMIKSEKMEKESRNLAEENQRQKKELQEWIENNVRLIESLKEKVAERKTKEEEIWSGLERISYQAKGTINIIREMDDKYSENLLSFREHLRCFFDQIYNSESNSDLI